MGFASTAAAAPNLRSCDNADGAGTRLMKARVAGLCRFEQGSG